MVDRNNLTFYYSIRVKSSKRSRWHPGTAPSELKEQLSGIRAMRRISKSDCRGPDGKLFAPAATPPWSEESVRKRWRYFPCKQIQMSLPIDIDNVDNVSFWLSENSCTWEKTTQSFRNNEKKNMHFYPDSDIERFFRVPRGPRTDAIASHEKKSSWNQRGVTGRKVRPPSSGASRRAAEM